jgi:hypothetical protein
MISFKRQTNRIVGNALNDGDRLGQFGSRKWLFCLKNHHCATSADPLKKTSTSLGRLVINCPLGPTLCTGDVKIVSPQKFSARLPGRCFSGPRPGRQAGMRSPGGPPSWRSQRNRRNMLGPRQVGGRETKSVVLRTTSCSPPTSKHEQQAEDFGRPRHGSRLIYSPASPCRLASIFESPWSWPQILVSTDCASRQDSSASTRRARFRRPPPFVSQRKRFASEG